jgi:hypothetical protein
MDDNGHGTHCAGIAAGKLDLDNDNVYEPENGEIWGVAPDATLFAYKVLDTYGSGWTSDVIAGIEAAVEDHADVISMSLGGFGNPDDPLSQAVDNAVAQGVVVVVAAGNEGPDYETISSPGTARKAITVGASNKSDQIADFSSRGPVKWSGKVLIKPDVLAPGVSVTSSVPTGTCELCDPSGYKSLSGTSMSTPHVAGLAALLKQAHPDWTPEIIKMVIRNTAKDLGYDIFTQGYGRIDVEAAINVTTSPPIAQLKEFSYEATGTIQIYGTATNTTSSFESYSLYYGEGYRPSSWNLICSSSNPVIDGLLCSFDTFQIKDGEYLIKLEVKDNLGRLSIDTNLIYVNNAEITSPLNNDIYRAGDAVEIKGKVISSILQNYSLEYGLGATPTDWILITSSTNRVTDGILGIWDTSSINQANFYTLRLTVNYSNGVSFSEYIKNIYLDPTLKEGWPKRLKEWYGYDEFWDIWTYYWGGLVEPVVSDLEGDGAKEIVIYQGGNPPKLYVFKENGIILDGWPVEVKNESLPGGNITTPSIADIDGDGKKEILINGSEKIYIYNLDGTLKKEISLPGIVLSSPVVVDLNNDQKLEIIVRFEGRIGEEVGEFLSIFDYQGNIMDGWPKLYYDFEHEGRYYGCFTFNSHQSVSAIGNFDDDSDLEIVVAGNRNVFDPDWHCEGRIYVFNLNGTIVEGFPVDTEGEIYSSPGIGDIDKDGNNEIVVGTLIIRVEGGNYIEDGKIYVIKKDGTILDGWPKSMGKGIWTSPALADLNEDGKLEIGIGVSTTTGNVYLFDYQGNIISGWPKNIDPWSSYIRSLLFVDINGDGKLDILANGGGIAQNSGIYAWDFQGNLIEGFPKITESYSHAGATIADIDGDGKLELVASSAWDEDLTTGKSKHQNTIYVWEVNQDYHREKMKWPMFHHDPQHSGLYGFTALSTKIWRIDKDTEPPYFTNTSTPQIEVRGEYGMKCRWGLEDLPYSDLSQENEMSCASGSPFSCFTNLPNMGEDGQKKIYVSCQDDFGNDQTKYQNLDIIFNLDTATPTISNLSVNKNSINRSDIDQDFVIVIDFSEEMSTETAPTIIFDPDISIALINCTSTWASTTQYIYSCKIADSDIKAENIDIVISGAKDLAGNILSDRVVDKFSINTKKPAPPGGFYLPPSLPPSQPPPKEEVKKPEIEKLMEKINQLKALISQYQSLIQQIVAQRSKQILSEIPPDFKFENPIRYGNRGNEVRYLQILLRSLGFYKGPINGINDLSTLLAIRKFQLTYGLITPQTPKSISGYVGPATRAKLNEILESLRKSNP